MAGTIKQIQMRYDSEQDRILLRLNNSDNEQFRFWLTRRYCLIMLKVLNEHGPQKTDSEQRGAQPGDPDQNLNRVNFEEEFKDDETTSHPLGEDILLAFKLTYKRTDDVFTLSIEPKSGKGIRLVINPDINFSLCQLMMMAAEKGQWNLDREFPEINWRPPNRMIN
jgi:hypothetical protein